MSQALIKSNNQIETLAEKVCAGMTSKDTRRAYIGYHEQCVYQAMNDYYSDLRQRLKSEK